jgi:hypothetical protein
MQPHTKLVPCFTPQTYVITVMLSVSYTHVIIQASHFFYIFMLCITVKIQVLTGYQHFRTIYK